MNELITKISSYDLFNYLFPGILFVTLAKALTPFSLIQSDLVIGLFVYYFIGLVISRVGSLIVEPFLKWTHFVVFADYPKYIAAAKKDTKIELLSEVNNTYRTITSMLLLLMLAKFYEYLVTIRPALTTLTLWIVMILLFLLFLFSYRKQTNYISKRVMKK